LIPFDFGLNNQKSQRGKKSAHEADKQQIREKGFRFGGAGD